MIQLQAATRSALMKCSLRAPRDPGGRSLWSAPPAILQVNGGTRPELFYDH